MSGTRHRKIMAVWSSALIAAMVLAACGGDEPAESVGDEPAESVSDETPDGGQEITFFGWDVADTSAGLGVGYQAAKEVWAEETGNIVTFDGAPFDSYVATATTRGRSGELGDVVELLPDLSHSAIFPVLAPTTKEDYPDFADDLFGWSAGVMDEAKPDEFAGVPIGAQGTLFYYNKAVFREAGLDPESPPRTWADFEAALEAIKATGKTPLGMSGSDSFLLWWSWNAITPQFFATPEDLQAIRSGEIPLNDERFYQSLLPLQSTYEKGYWNEDFASKTFSDLEAEFIAGNVGVVAGLITPPMNWRVWDDQLGEDAYGVFSAPLVDGGAQIGQFFNPVLLYGLSKDTENVDVARSWISFLASKEGQEIMLQETGQFPNRDDIDLAAVAESSGAVAIRELVDEAEGGTPAAQNFFNTDVAFTASQNITSAIVDDDLRGFLDDLERLHNG